MNCGSLQLPIYTFQHPNSLWVTSDLFRVKIGLLGSHLPLNIEFSPVWYMQMEIF